MAHKLLLFTWFIFKISDLGDAVMQRTALSRGTSLLAMSCVILALSLGACKDTAPQFTTEYQAVFMDNGQVFFGKLDKAGSEYPQLRDVYYVQSQSNPETREVKSMLIKRGSEWHGPDVMYINARHIVVIEPVASDSRVAQLIKEAKKK
jgi:hypothetical protein